MDRITYKTHIVPLLVKLMPQFMAARMMKLAVRKEQDKWYVTQTASNGNTDIIFNGTLRECYAFLLGMSEFLI